MAYQRFLMPQSNAKAVPPFWYDYILGPIHFVVVSSEHDNEAGSPQNDWLIDVLEVRRPWNVSYY